MGEYAITVFSLLAEGHKREVYDKRSQINIVSFPNMDEEQQQQMQKSLQLPDDLLSDILEDEKYDDISKVKNILEG